MHDTNTPSAWLQSLGALFFPHLCAGCNHSDLPRSQPVCIRCLAVLPETHFEDQPDNPVEQLFRGRIPVRAACSRYYFTRSSTLQHILHALKYRGNRQAGNFLGGLVGEGLRRSGRFDHIDGVLPLPLHPKRERNRGYNQAAVIAAGIRNVWGIPPAEGIVVREIATATQTKKNRMDRWKNVSEVFRVQDPAAIRGRHLLLVDDVVTTGASLEACGSSLLLAGVAGLSIATVAHAEL